MYGTSDNSSIDLTVEEEGEEATDGCLQEIERINREIETVRHQVEREQRRLTHYQNKKSVSKSERSNKNVPFSPPKKYILDSSKPRTDLEYDPLSNYSSDLCSYRASKKECKNGQKREQCTLNQAKPNIPQKLSPAHLDSNEDDDVLIIDIPPSPAKTKEKSPPVTNSQSADNVFDSLVPTNLTGHLVNVVKSPATLDPVISTVKTNNMRNDFKSEEENIFVKMSQHLSDYDKTNPAQPCDLQNNSLFAKILAPKVVSVSEPKHSQIQKPQCPPYTMANTDNSSSKKKASPPKPNVSIAQNTKSEKMQPCTQQAEMVFVGSLCEPRDILIAANLTQTTPVQSASMNPPTPKNKEDVILIDLSSEDELNYSDMELSESDPDEECYRIFMEANAENNNPPVELVRNIEVERPDEVEKPQALSGKKRVAHEARPTELAPKSRPQPQVLVPLREASSGFASQTSVPSMMRKVEQRASVLTSSVKAGQALVFKGHSETPPPAPSSVPTNPAQYVSYIPVGATLINMGNNLHLVLPEGTFPVTDGSSRITSVLTPISQVNTCPITIKPVTIKPPCHPTVPSQQKRPMPPVIIPPLARRPASASSAAASTNLCTSTPAPVVKPTAKRKIKQCEIIKVPHDIRQSYVNKFTEEFLKTTTNVTEAFEKALAEERTVYNRSANKLKYLSVAVNALKRLRNHSSGPDRDKHQICHKTKGTIPLNISLVKGQGDITLYECLKDYVLTEEILIESNFPLKHPEKPGCAVLFADDNKKNISDPLRKLCCRCGATYSVSRTGKHTRKEECTYHYGKGVEKKVPGGVETRYSCCEGVMGSPGCQVFKLHVSNSLSMDGFVSTVPACPSDTSCPGVYSLDCEMCYTNHGLELSRVTVVNSSLQIVYDTFVRPQNEVIDYNTRFSGIGEEEMKSHCCSLKEVQKTLLSFIRADTILIGHGLETDLCVLKLIHGMVVDTSVVFPHRLGPPHKLPLNSLTAEYIRKIIQESESGHDTAEDAAACMELMLWKAKEDGKMKKIQ